MNLFIFELFPEKFRVLSFSVFGEFVYFWTFPGKIQSFQFLMNLFNFGLFLEKKIRVFTLPVYFMVLSKTFYRMRMSYKAEKKPSPKEWR